MKKCLLLLLVGLCGICFGQAPFDTTFVLKPGEKASWHPFEACNMLQFNTTGSNVARIMPKPNGTIAITALKDGEATITASCGDIATTVKVIVSTEPLQKEKEIVRMERPVTQPFAGTYRFNPPADHYFISYSDPMGKSVETRAKIGDEESYNDGKGWDRYWNVKTGESFFFHLDKGWKEDVKFDFEPFGESFYPLNAFATEVDPDLIATRYIGMENCQNIDCWVFFDEKEDGSIVRYWVDPSNGCTLKRQVNFDDPCVVKVYNLNYTKWEFGPRRKKSYHDVTR